MTGLADMAGISYTTLVVAMGALVLGITTGVLGTFAVLRQRSLVGDALAHAALPGVCIAFLLTGAKEPSTLLAGAGLAGLVGAFMMVGIERTSRIRPDAAIGVVLSSFFALGIVLLTYISHTGNANQAGLETYLFGQAAGLLERDVRAMTLLGAAALAVVAIGFRPLKATLFDAAFSSSAGLPVRMLELLMTAMLVVAVVVGLRTVGAIMMVAMLVIPAAAARQLTNRLATLLPLAGLVGALVGVSGALLSSHLQMPTGPVIVLVGFAGVTAAVLLAPRRGVLWRARKLARDRRRLATEAVLLDLDALGAGPDGRSEAVPAATIAEAAHRPARMVQRSLAELSRAQLVTADGSGFRLTEAGAEAARRLHDERMLWSRWLEHGWRLHLPDAREPDPRTLRGMLGEDLVQQLMAPPPDQRGQRA